VRLGGVRLGVAQALLEPALPRAQLVELAPDRILGRAAVAARRDLWLRARRRCHHQR